MKDKDEIYSPQKSRTSFVSSTQYFHGQNQSCASPINLKKNFKKSNEIVGDFKYHTIDTCTKELHSTSDPSNYFFYKNFQVVKHEGALVSLGKGQASEVLQVRNKSDGKEFAMKAINKKKVDNFKRLIVDLNANFRLKHRNIIEFFSYSETKDYLYVFMEKGGPTLRTEIKNKMGLGETLSKRYLRNIIEALDYIHKSGYCHCSLSSANIHIFNDTNAKVTSFKYAVDHNRRTEESFFTDYWSLGAILYECLSGVPIQKVKIKIIKIRMSKILLICLLLNRSFMERR